MKIYQYLKGSGYATVTHKMMIWGRSMSVVCCLIKQIYGKDKGIKKKKKILFQRLKFTKLSMPIQNLVIKRTWFNNQDHHH